VRLGQGREQARLFLKENKDVAKEIHQKILAQRAAAENPAPAAEAGRPGPKNDKAEKADKPEAKAKAAK
jgi:recombination protein RecA